MQGKRGRPVDQAARKRALTWGTEKGIRVYIPAESLRKAGVPEDASSLYYRLWAAPRGRVIVRVYTEP